VNSSWYVAWLVSIGAAMATACSGPESLPEVRPLPALERLQTPEALVVPPPPPPPPPPSKLCPDSDEVRAPATIDEATRLAGLEAIVRWALRRGRRDGTTVYLSLGHDEDPPAQLLQRLADLAFLRPVSACPRKEAYGQLVPDPPKGSVVLSLSSTVWYSRHELRAFVGWNHSPTFAGGCYESFAHTRSGWRHRECPSLHCVIS
jgi:hypothetical protein